MAAKEVKRRGRLGKKTYEIISKKFEKRIEFDEIDDEGFKYFVRYDPLNEVCNLPILFKTGDIIKERDRKSVV